MILSGHLFGGAIIMTYALRYPKDVCGLILFGVAVKFRPSLYVIMGLSERA